MYRHADMAQRGLGDVPEDLLVVAVDDRRCALRTRDVVEVQPIVLVDALPSAPAVVEGVIDLRGHVVAVVSLRRRFGLADRLAHPGDRLVIVDVRSRRVALHVDGAVELRTVRPEEVEPAPPDEAAAYAVGVARLSDGLVVIHDLAAFLASDEAVALDSALALRSGLP
ncbi:MAG: hypothetical protein GEV08_24620 [Acidimicrobiia bacterium]|nr:hypothetical protein [Acidimicrobiia bacterium]